jgi:hypothetical protein
LLFWGDVLFWEDGEQLILEKRIRNRSWEGRHEWVEETFHVPCFEYGLFPLKLHLKFDYHCGVIGGEVFKR